MTYTCQTNAILFRQGKLEPDGAPFIWQPFRKLNGACVESGASRTRAIMQRFKDAATGKRCACWKRIRSAAAARASAVK